MEVRLPILRMAPDTTLADTLGNLGQSLAQALDPRTAAQAQLLADQIQNQRFELQRQQAIDAANSNAASVYGNANPHGLSPADLAVAQSQIRNGTFNPAGTIEALKAAGSFGANQAAANLIDATHPEWSPGQRASAKADVLSGRKNLNEVESDFASAGLSTAKTGAAIGAGDAAASAASQPGMTPEASALARSQALTDPTAAEKIVAAQRARVAASNMNPGTSQFSPAVSTLSTDQGIAGIGQTLPAQIQPQKLSTDLSADVAKRSMGPMSPEQVIRGGTWDPMTGMFTPAAPATPNAPTTPPTPGATGTVTVAPAPPDTGAISASTSAQASSKAATDFASAQLEEGISDGIAGKKVMTDIKQLRRLSDLMDNDGPMTQIQNEIASRAYSSIGLTPTQGQSAREVFDTYKAALMANWRKDEGIQRLALPEIQLGNISLPSARMSRDALNQALDQFEARAALGVKVGEAATKYWDTGPTPANAAKFFTERDQIYAPENNPTNKIRQDRESAAPPPSQAQGVPNGAVRANPYTGATERMTNGIWVPVGKRP
jgi:hypothetical protein